MTPLNGRVRLTSFNVSIQHNKKLTVVNAHLDAWEDNKEWIKEFLAMSEDDQIDIITSELFGAGCQMAEVIIDKIDLL